MSESSSAVARAGHMKKLVDLMPVKIAGMGHYLPGTVLKSDQIEERLHIPRGWISKHTGVEERRIAEKGQLPSDLAAEASWKAMKSAGISPKDIDLILFGSTGRDMAIPATACILQDKISAKNAATFDINAVCLSFLVGLDMAHYYVATGKYETVLVVSAEIPSRVVNWEDKFSCGLFGDGAGAAVITRADPAKESSDIIYSYFGCDGSKREAITVRGFGLQYLPHETQQRPELNLFKMDGLASFKYAMEIAPAFFKKLFEGFGYSAQEIDWVIPHQANLPGLKKFMRAAKVPFEKCYINIQKYGNTSSASIPIALSEAVAEGKVQRGSKLVLAATAAGFSWGGCCLVY